MVISLPDDAERGSRPLSAGGKGHAFWRNWEGTNKDVDMTTSSCPPRFSLSSDSTAAADMLQKCNSLLIPSARESPFEAFSLDVWEKKKIHFHFRYPYDNENNHVGNDGFVRSSLQNVYKFTEKKISFLWIRCLFRHSTLWPVEIQATAALLAGQTSPKTL